MVNKRCIFLVKGTLTLLVCSRESLGHLFQLYRRVEAGSETEILVTAPAQVLRLAS